MKRDIGYLLLIVVMGAILLLAMLAITDVAMADGEDTVYVLCNPESYVNIREKPSKRSHQAGFAYCGDDFRTDGKTRNGFLHVFAGTETGEGWISTGFIVYCKPEKVDEVWTVESNGRVAVRSTIGGKRSRWLKNGDSVKVYYVAEVAVTGVGFVDAEYVSPKQ